MPLEEEVGSSFTVFPHAAKTLLSTQSAAAIRQFYTIDIIMPGGTSLVASRSGTVVRIERQFVDGDNQVGHENFIDITIDDDGCVLLTCEYKRLLSRILQFY